MDSAGLKFCAKQILIHWIQSRSPLERVVSGVFKETGMGSSERKELQLRVFTWSRYWPLFSSTFNMHKIDSASETKALMDRIEETWNWGSDRWIRLHQKSRPQASENLKKHLLNIHGVHSDILALFSENDLENFHDYLHASLAEAPLVIRCRDLEAKELLVDKYPELEFETGAFFELCLKTSHRWSATQSAEYLDGLFEVQDESSQLVSLFCEVQPGMKILDLCAGAGGKSLHLSNLMLGQGEIHCWDPSHKKLQELQKRSRRWGYNNIRTLNQAPKNTEKYDLVLVDAPCSSLGTLRRRPQLLGTTSSQDFVRLSGLQRELISRAFDQLNKSGTVVYATCSVMVSENYAQVRKYPVKHLDQSPKLEAFLSSLSDCPAAKISSIPLPEFGKNCAQVSASGNFSGDGFFVARMSSN
jgi:16S rRNA C967 or C1407 C5-methylase (RsmB/RsmF family)